MPAGQMGSLASSQVHTSRKKSSSNATGQVFNRLIGCCNKEWMSLNLRRGCRAPTSGKFWIWSRSKSQVNASTPKVLGRETTVSHWRKKNCWKRISHIECVKRSATTAGKKPELHLLFIWRGKSYFYHARENKKTHCSGPLVLYLTQILALWVTSHV